MNIKIVSDLTKLTKKAIKYYEQEGLISPIKNEENNYREYTSEDVITLNLIGALRILNISVNDIKRIIKGECNIIESLNIELKRIEGEIEELENNKMIINMAIKRAKKDFSCIGNDIKQLSYGVKHKGEYVKDKIIEAFPGRFGEFMVLGYEPFLNVKIDSEEKERAWVRLVEILDNLEGYNDEEGIFKDFTEDKLEEFKIQNKANTNHFTKVLNREKEALEKYKNAMITFVKNIKENPEYNDIFEGTYKNSKMMIASIGMDNEDIEECFLVLSEDYREYKKVIDKVMKEVDKVLLEEYGITLREFWKIN